MIKFLKIQLAIACTSFPAGVVAWALFVMDAKTNSRDFSVWPFWTWGLVIFTFMEGIYLFNKATDNNSKEKKDE